MTHYTISITSDTVCPWCYVGHKRLQKAIAAHQAKHPDDTFSTTWLPYYLNPDAPTTSVDKRAYYEARFGAGQAAGMFARLAGVGAQEGIAFRFGGRTGNTRASHRALELARQRGGEAGQTAAVEALFRAYFEEERDITDVGVLAEAVAGAATGMQAAEVRAWLEAEGDQGGAVVDREVQEARRKVISGVPHFEIQEQFEVSGAQEPAAFLQLFERVKSRM